MSTARSTAMDSSTARSSTSTATRRWPSGGRRPDRRGGCRDAAAAVPARTHPGPVRAPVHAPGDYRRVVLWVAVFLVIVVAGWIATAAQSYLTSWVGERVLADIRVAVFAHVQRLDLGFFER